MANKRISTLDPLTTPADGDILPITDVSDLTGSAQGTTKGVTVTNLMGQAPVQSVNTATGAVVLDADDIDDSSTSHKFVTASDITNLSNLSGTNTGDQDLSALATQVSLGNHEALTSLVHGISAFGATLVDDADAATARTTLGLGTAATTASTDYATEAQGILADSALQSVSAGDLTDGNFDGEAILGFKASLPTEITAATYTVQDSDNGQVIRVNHATGCTVTIPSGLFTTDSTGFNCSFIQVGAGQITFANDGTSVINNRQSHTKTNAQWAATSVVSTANNVFVLAGDTAS